MDPAAALRATPAFVEPPAALGPGARRQVRRAHAGVLLFFVVDGLLLTAYGSIGTVSPHLGWLYALTGCSVSVSMIRWFWQRGATVRDHDRLSLALSLVACLVMSTTSGLAAPVAGLMMMSIMSVMALGAVQLKGSVVIGLCAALPVVELAVLQYTGSTFGIPVGTPSERLLTSLWLAWLMAKCSAHNIAGTELRALVNQANAELAKALHALEIVAATDVLTGLPNRRAIVDELDRALQVRPVGEVLPDGGADDRIGVALLDLDHFKQVNDLHGHDVGDEVLRVFGRASRSRCRSASRSSIAARPAAPRSVGRMPRCTKRNEAAATGWSWPARPACRTRTALPRDSAATSRSSAGRGRAPTSYRKPIENHGTSAISSTPSTSATR